MTFSEEKLQPLTPDEFTKRRAIEKAFEVFCKNKTGDALDKLKLFIFEELAKMQISKMREGQR